MNKIDGLAKIGLTIEYQTVSQSSLRAVSLAVVTFLLMLMSALSLSFTATAACCQWLEQAAETFFLQTLLDLQTSYCWLLLPLEVAAEVSLRIAINFRLTLLFFLDLTALHVSYC